MLDISPGTSKSNLSRARQHLRALFSDDFEFKK
jgi:DNA-directed RNA polymerase specialized sigma24 family protein